MPITVTDGVIVLNNYNLPAVGTPVVIATPYSATVAEGNVLIVTVTGSNITNGTYYWRVDSNPEDFIQFAGSFEMSNNLGSFSVAPTLDTLTSEGSEALNISIRSDTTTGQVLTTANATILDVNYTIYLLNGNVLIENQTLGFWVIGSNIPIGPTYYYTVNHITTSDDDFAYGTHQGIFPITTTNRYTADGGVTYSFYNNVLIGNSDGVAEGAEYFTVSLRLGSVTGPILATSTSLTLQNA
jgi:hypothetical protein